MSDGARGCKHHSSNTKDNSLINMTYLGFNIYGTVTTVRSLFKLLSIFFSVLVLVTLLKPV